MLLVTLRRATQADLAAVQQLFGALHSFNATLDARFALADGWETVLKEHLGHACDHPHSLTVLAWADDEPVGLLMLDGHTDSPLFRHRHWAELVALYVAPSQRGSGLATRLVAAGSAWAHAQGYDRVQLYVTRSNLSAQHFYVRHGFAPVQEVWRLELEPSDRLPPDDPDCEAVYAHGHNLLSSHQHVIAVGDEEIPA